MASALEKLTARLSKEQLKVIDDFVKDGFYSSRVDFIRQATQELITKELPNYQQFIEYQKNKETE